MSHILCCCYMYVCVTVVDLTCDCCRVYIVAVIRPYIPTLFFGALILGSAGGGMKKNSEFVLDILICFVVVLWTAQGQILIQNSSKDKMGTTSGIFWFMLQQRYMYMYMYINYVYWIFEFFVVVKGD